MCEREGMGPPPPGNYWLCRRPVREGSVRDGGGEESPRGLCSGAQSLSQIQHSFPLLPGLCPQPNGARPSGEDCFYKSISMHSQPSPSLNLASLGHSITGSRPAPPVWMCYLCGTFWHAPLSLAFSSGLCGMCTLSAKHFPKKEARSPNPNEERAQLCKLITLDLLSCLNQLFFQWVAPRGIPQHLPVVR